MSRHSTARETRALLEQQGWVFELAGNGHYKGTHPEANRPIYVSATSCNHSARVKALAVAKRALRPT